METIDMKPLEKRKQIRESIKRINALRQAQINAIEDNLLALLRDSIKLGKKTMRGEKSLEEYMNHEKQVISYVMEFFGEKKFMTRKVII